MFSLKTFYDGREIDACTSIYILNSHYKYFANYRTE